MQDMDFTQQAAILGDEDLTADVTPPEIIPMPVESAKKSRKQPVKDMKEVIRYSLFVTSQFNVNIFRDWRTEMLLERPVGNYWAPCQCNNPVTLYFSYLSYLYEPEGNACSLTDSTAEEHVLALVEHSADEARDRITRYMPNSKVFHLTYFV